MINTRIVLSRGLNTFVLLGIIFVGLKLTGSTTWSWWLVLLPLYGPIFVGLVILLFATLVGLTDKILKAIEDGH